LSPFTARHTPLELLDVVRVVAEHANPGAPTGVSGRVWNAHRGPAGRPDAPLASSVAKRLELPWAQVLAVAAAPPEERLRRLRQLQSDQGRKGLSLVGVRVALRQAAVRLEQSTLTRADYQRGREMIVAASHRTRHAAIAQRAMPELSQIDSLLRRYRLTWEQALEQAGLQAAERVVERGMALEDAVQGFVEDTGHLPRTRRHLWDWAAQRGIALARIPQAKVRIKAAVDEIARQRARDGLPALTPLVAADVQLAGRAGERQGPPARRYRWTRATLIAGLALAMAQLEPGQELDQRTLKRIAAARSDLPIPSYSVVNRHLRKHHPGETWEQWRREAEAIARSTGP
jgi:hypothetical protein